MVCGLKVIQTNNPCMDKYQQQAQQQLGVIVRRRRDALGYSQEEFAEQCGMHRTYMGAIERGERNVSLLNLRRIAAALGLDLSALLAEAGL